MDQRYRYKFCSDPVYIHYTCTTVLSDERLFDIKEGRGNPESFLSVKLKGN